MKGQHAVSLSYEIDESNPEECKSVKKSICVKIESTAPFQDNVENNTKILAFKMFDGCWILYARNIRLLEGAYLDLNLKFTN